MPQPLHTSLNPPEDVSATVASLLAEFKSSVGAIRDRLEALDKLEIGLRSCMEQELGKRLSMVRHNQDLTVHLERAEHEVLILKKDKRNALEQAEENLRLLFEYQDLHPLPLRDTPAPETLATGSE